MDKHRRKSRRNFIKMAAGAATLTVGASKTFTLNPEAYGQTTNQTKSVSPNDKIQIALIGAGGQGIGDAQASLRVPGVELVAVADVYDGRLTRSKELWGNDLFTTRDYREILAQPDIDAVIIATPDHWHAKMAIDALNAGKHVYLEKPMIQHASEGKGLVEAQRKTGKIIQIGSQRVSSIIYAKAKELLESKAIGDLTIVEANWHRNSALGAWQYSIPPNASPQTVDWDRFIGHAPKRPFEPIRLFRWRNYRDYGTGVPGDLFVHLFSGIHYVLNSNGPNRIMATGGLRYWNDGRDVPDVMIGIYDYPKTTSHPAFNLALKVNFMDGSGGEETFRFVGSEGILTIGNGVSVTYGVKQREPGYTIETFPESVQKQYLEEYRKKYPPQAPAMTARKQENFVAPQGYRDHYDHHKNFYTCIRENKPVVEDAVFGFRAAGPAVLTNNSYFENRIINWDPEEMKVKDAAISRAGIK